MRSLKFLIGALVVAALGGYAIAQGIPIPQVPFLNQNDLIQVIPRGQPQTGNVYATPGAIAGIESYSYQVPLTAFTITVPNGVDVLYLNPAGTLATGTLTMMAQPSDGQRFALESSQTQTAITIQANTGQTLTAGTYGLATPTALVANTRYAWMYIASQAAWVRVS